MNEPININLENNLTLPSSQYVEFKAMQNFFDKKIGETNVKFERREDMITMCLSLFIHDFAHDFNFQSMFSRILKDNSDLYNSFGITIGNNVLKSFVVGHRKRLDESNGKKFQNAESKYDVANDFLKLKKKYNEMLKTYEIPIDKQSGGERMDTLIEAEEISLEPQEKFVEKEIQNDKTIENVLEIPTNEIISKPEIYNKLVEKFENNPDFLEFYSSLNTYILCYLNEDIVSMSKFDNIKSAGLDKNKMYNFMMYNSVVSSFKYIIEDFRTANESVLDEEKYTETNIDFIRNYSDIFEILLLSFERIFSKTNENFEIDIFDVLSSPQVLKQFIIYFHFYLTFPEIKEFNQNIETKKMYGGMENAIELAMDKEEEEEEEIKSFEREPLTEFVGATHNNLMTTITRGIFLKTGLWNDFWKWNSKKNSSSEEKIPGFNAKNLTQLSYENLSDMFPLDPKIGGNMNNHFLIIEIVILKQLLLELSPFKMYVVGAKIDDRLKDYMDMFFYKFYGFEEQAELEYDAPELNDVTNKINEIYKNLREEYPDVPEVTPEFESFYLDILFREIGETDEDVDDETSDESSIVVESKKPYKPDRLKLENVFSSYKLNMVTIQNLMNTTIKPIKVTDGEFSTTLNNYFDLFLMNVVITYLVAEDGKVIEFPIQAPRLTYIINNAANINQNLNGSRLILPNYIGEELYEETLMKYLNEDGELKIIEKAKLLELYKTELEHLSQLTEEFKEEYADIKKERNAELKEELKEDFKSRRREQVAPLENEVFLLKTILDENEFGEQAKIAIEENKKKDKERDKLKKKEKKDTSSSPLTIDVSPLTIIETDVKPDVVADQNEVADQTEVVDISKEEEMKGGETANLFTKQIVQNYSKWFKNAMPFFGVYKNIKKGVMCPGSSMMDAMDNCSLKYGATEPKEVGTTNFQLIYEGDQNTKISYGGGIIYYNNENPKMLTCNIDFRLVCGDDEAVISTNDIQVYESRNLKSNVVYQGVLHRLKKLFKENIGREMEDMSELEAVKDETLLKEYMLNKFKNLWIPLQYSVSKENYNKLIGATALKTLGDFLQECQAVMKWGGYVNTTDNLYQTTKSLLEDRSIKPIYRSVDEPDTIMPYNMDGDALRFGIQGDRPSGFRSIYMVLCAKEGINEHCVTGYVKNNTYQKPSRTLLVARNQNIYDESINSYGKLIYVTPNVKNLDDIDLESSFTGIKLKEIEKPQEIPSNILPGSIEEPKNDLVVDESEPVEVVTGVTIKKRGRKPGSKNANKKQLLIIDENEEKVGGSNKTHKNRKERVRRTTRKNGKNIKSKKRKGTRKHRKSKKNYKKSRKSHD